MQYKRPVRGMASSTKRAMKKKGNKPVKKVGNIAGRIKTLKAKAENKRKNRMSLATASQKLASMKKATPKKTTTKKTAPKESIITKVMKSPKKLSFGGTVGGVSKGMRTKKAIGSTSKMKKGGKTGTTSKDYSWR